MHTVFKLGLGNLKELPPEAAESPLPLLFGNHFQPMTYLLKGYRLKVRR